MRQKSVVVFVSVEKDTLVHWHRFFISCPKITEKNLTFKLFLLCTFHQLFSIVILVICTYCRMFVRFLCDLFGKQLFDQLYFTVGVFRYCCCFFFFPCSLSFRPLLLSLLPLLFAICRFFEKCIKVVFLHRIPYTLFQPSYNPTNS